MNFTAIIDRPLSEQEQAWARDALVVQNASNLSGVAHAFAELQSAMVTAGLDTEARANHPASKLYACKIADLVGLSYWYDSAAEQAAKGLIEQPQAA